MKISLLLPAIVGLAFVSSASAQSTLEKIEDKTKQAVRATGNALEKAARKTGEAVENVTNSAEEKLTRDSDKTTRTIDKDARVVESDISNSTIYQKVEHELGKPLSPEQRAQYAAAWQAARDKARAAETEFADQISAITTVSATKTRQIVHDTGL